MVRYKSTLSPQKNVCLQLLITKKAVPAFRFLSWLRCNGHTRFMKVRYSTFKWSYCTFQLKLSKETYVGDKNFCIAKSNFEYSFCRTVGALNNFGYVQFLFSESHCSYWFRNLTFIVFSWCCDHISLISKNITRTKNIVRSQLKCVYS